MATLTIPDELKAEAEAEQRAAAAGYAGVDAYVAAVLRGETVPQADSELEQALPQRLDGGPGVELTPEFVEQFKREVRERRESNGLRP